MILKTSVLTTYSTFKDEEQKTRFLSNIRYLVFMVSQLHTETIECFLGICNYGQTKGVAKGRHEEAAAPHPTSAKYKKNIEIRVHQKIF